jgi:hypothetical protein
MPREATVHFLVKMRPTERDALERLADGQPVAAYIRGLINSIEPATFAPTVRGRRWEPNPQDRHLRKNTA